MQNTQSSINRVCEYRGLPQIKKGYPCTVDGKSGRVWGGNSAANLNVKFDGQRGVSNCHPYWRMRITDENGNTIYESPAEQAHD